MAAPAKEALDRSAFRKSHVFTLASTNCVPVKFAPAKLAKMKQREKSDPARHAEEKL
jgi:hypothetical protein